MKDFGLSSPYLLVPVALLLCALIIYSLVGTVSEEDKQKILYGELVLSFILSLPLLFFSILFFMGLVSFGIMSVRSLILIIISVLVILLNPFVITIIRLNLKEYKQYDKALSILTILTSLFIALNKTSGIPILYGMG
jgi:hypothetical protein